MAATTMQIADATYATLQRLAQEQGRTIGQVLADAIDRYEREQFLTALNEDYTRLRADPVVWADWQDELKSVEGTLMDGLEDDLWVK